MGGRGKELGDLSDTKRCNDITEVPQEKEKFNTEKIFQDIIVKTVPKLVEYINLRIQGTEQTRL